MSDIYEKLSRPPTSALRTIKNCRIQGFTDVKPQWRIKAMTEMFGLCGIGWKYTIDKVWTEPGSDGAMMCFAQISMQIYQDGKWSESIPGIGGNKIIRKETNGMYDDDEGYKMAVTDALSVAMKTIGVAADIYMGNWDGSKYRDETKDENAALQSWLMKITLAKDETELKGIYNQAVDATNNLPEARAAVVQAKDKRKKELGL